MENTSYVFPSFYVRAVVEPHTHAYSRIVYHFGPEILLENGEIDRQKLGQLIFANEEKRRLLNSITHPEIHKAMLKEILFYFLKGEGLTEFGSRGKGWPSAESEPKLFCSAAAAPSFFYLSVSNIMRDFGMFQTFFYLKLNEVNVRNSSCTQGTVYTPK